MLDGPMYTDSMAQLLNDPVCAARAFKEADSLTLGKIPGKMTMYTCELTCDGGLYL